jgi:hypothetical protein
MKTLLVGLVSIQVQIGLAFSGGAGSLALLSHPPLTAMTAVTFARVAGAEPMLFFRE